ncbi:MAG: zinc transporter ZntB [Oricola sp.]
MASKANTVSAHLQEGTALVLELDGKGGCRRVDEDGIAGWQRRGKAGFLWTHVHRDAPEIGALLAQNGCDEFVRDALSADDTRPRCTTHAGGAIIILRGIDATPGAEPDDTASVRFWVEEGRVIGVWRRPLQAISDILEAIADGRGPRSPGDLVATVALKLADKAEPIVTDLSEQIDDMEERLDEDLPAANRRELADIRRSAIHLRRYMFPQRDALSTLEIENLPFLAEHDRSRVREAAARVTRLAEELDAIRDRAQIVYDEIMDRRSEVMNRNTLLLAIVAAIFLPLGLITGLLGINVGGIPGATSANAFWIVTAILGGIAVIEILIVRWLRMY